VKGWRARRARKDFYSGCDSAFMIMRNSFARVITMIRKQGQSSTQGGSRWPPASDEHLLAQITKRMEDAASGAGVGVDELMAETLIARAEIVRAEFGETT